MTDPSTSVGELRKVVRDFVHERDWEQFHTPKNLSMALAIEVAELMEHFQWISPAASRRVQDQPESLREVRDELADCLCYVLAIANTLEIDLSSALHDKMVKNREEYPINEFRGRFGPNDDGRGDDGRGDDGRGDDGRGDDGPGDDGPSGHGDESH